LAAAAAALPKPGGPVVATPLAGSAKPAWSLAFQDPPGPGADVFPDAPEGWYFSAKRNVDGRFDLTLEQRPDGGGPMVDVSLVVAGGGQAAESTLRLDAGAAKP
jgi:hypothetical protein